jgi:hypothetical protein
MCRWRYPLYFGGRSVGHLPRRRLISVIGPALSFASLRWCCLFAPGRPWRLGAWEGLAAMVLVWRWLGLCASLVPQRGTSWLVSSGLISNPWGIIGRSPLAVRPFNKVPRSRFLAARSAAYVPSLADHGGKGGWHRGGLCGVLSFLNGRGGEVDRGTAQSSSFLSDAGAVLALAGL